jgi:translation elongation factor P/translation initiation factor 5A
MASLIEAIDIKRKMYFEFEGAPYHCLEVEVSKPTARGGQTLVRLKMRNLLTRAVFDKTFKASDKFKEPDLAVVPASFSYVSGDSYHFMDQETYEELTLNSDLLGDDRLLLSDNLIIQGSHCLHVFGSRCFDRCHTRIYKRAGVLHPLSLILGSVFHHQQVSGLGKHQRLHLQYFPVTVVFGRIALDINQRIGIGNIPKLISKLVEQYGPEKFCKPCIICRARLLCQLIHFCYLTQHIKIAVVAACPAIVH